MSITPDHPRITVTDAGCWQVSGSCNGAGYKRIMIAGDHDYAHRHAYRQYKGEIPDGFEIDHLCRNRSCCNPAHLEAVTRAENMRRGVVARLGTTFGRRTIKDGDGDPRHGTVNGYNNLRCRCADCRKAWADHMRPYHASRRATRTTTPTAFPTPPAVADRDRGPFVDAFLHELADDPRLDAIVAWAMAGGAK